MLLWHIMMALGVFDSSVLFSGLFMQRIYLDTPSVNVNYLGSHIFYDDFKPHLI